MNILHVVHAYTPSVGGSQVLIQRVSETLVQQYGHQVSVLTSTARTIEHFTNPRMPGLLPGEEEINRVSVRRLAVQNRLGPAWRILAGVAYRLHLPGNGWLRTAENGPWLRGLAQAIRVSQADVVLAATFPLKHMYDTLAATRRIGKPIVFPPITEKGAERREARQHNADLVMRHIAGLLPEEYHGVYAGQAI